MSQGLPAHGCPHVTSARLHSRKGRQGSVGRIVGGRGDAVAGPAGQDGGQLRAEANGCIVLTVASGDQGGKSRAFRAGKALHDIRTQVLISFPHHSWYVSRGPKWLLKFQPSSQHSTSRKYESRLSKDIPSLEKDTPWKSFMIIPFISHWLELSHRTYVGAVFG